MGTYESVGGWLEDKGFEYSQSLGKASLKGRVVGQHQFLLTTELPEALKILGVCPTIGVSNPRSCEHRRVTKLFRKLQPNYKK